MSEIIYLQSRSDIPTVRSWEDKQDFKKKNKTVTGKDGLEYTIEAKKIVKFSGLERFSRGILGILAVLFTLGISTLSRSVRRLFTKETKASRIFAVLKKDPIKPSKPISNNPDPSDPLKQVPGSDSSNRPDLLPQASDSNHPQCSSVSETKSALDFYTQAEQMSFWESYLSICNSALNNPKWENIKARLFLNEELKGIKNALVFLQKDVSITLRQYLEANKKIEADAKEAANSIRRLEQQIQNLIESIDRSLNQLQLRIDSNSHTIPSSQASFKVQGLANDGNTCYINSALQPLLAIGNFPDLVPDRVNPEPADSRDDRQAILDFFTAFLNDWKVKRSPTELGRRIGKLRHQIFQAGLLEGGFVNQTEERSYQDAGSFFELILHVIGRGFELESSRTPAMDDGVLVEGRKKVERLPNGVFYLKASGKSVQEKVDANRVALPQTLDGGCTWRIQHPVTGQSLDLRNYVETNTIIGQAPQILVVRVDPLIVNPTVDRIVNFAALLKNPPEDSNYELVGFSQNHGEEHWTSVVWDGKTWKYCDDSTVTSMIWDGKIWNSCDVNKVKHKEVQTPANYLVYKKMKGASAA